MLVVAAFYFQSPLVDVLDNPSPQNPYESPRPANAQGAERRATGEPLAEMDVVDILSNKQRWRLRLFADLLQFDSSTEQPPIEIVRSESPEKTTLHDSFFMKRCLEVKADKKRVFQFTAVDFATLTDWIGPPTQRDLVVALKRRFAWVLPVGILFVLSSLPLSGDADAGIEPLAFDPIFCGLGIGLVTTGALSRFVAHRVFFLVDSLWFLILAGNITYDILAGASWLWMILVLLQITLVASGFMQYRRFQSVRPSSSVPT